MKTRFRLPLLISALVLALILAACDRPDAGVAISNPPTTSAQDVQSTLNAPDVSAQQTAEAINNNPPPNVSDATPEPTALPAQPPEETSVPLPTAVPEQPTAEPAPANTPDPNAPTSQQGCSSPYTVKTGEWLFSIGRTCGVNPYAIAQANGIYPPYYFIYPGQQLTIPGGSPNPNPQPTTTPGSKTYVVKPGDNLFRIALSYGVSLQALAAANGISNYNLIYVGQKLSIP